MSKKLKGYIQSGILFIGDPQYMSGPAEYVTKTVGMLNGRELSPGYAVDITPEDPYNPFRRWDDFRSKVGEDDLSLPFPGAYTASDGRGVAVNTHRVDSQYEIEKHFDDSGKLLEIRIKFRD